MFEILGMIAIATSPILLVGGIISGIWLARKAQHRADIVFDGHWLAREEQVLAINHLRTKPEEWLIKKDFLRYPKSGNMAKITIEKDKNTGYYDFQIDGDKSIIKRGYIYNILERDIDALHQEQQYKKAADMLFPDGVPLMLADNRKPKKKVEVRDDFFTQANFITSKYQNVFELDEGRAGTR